MADPFDVLRRDHRPARPDPRFAVSLRQRLEEELGMTTTLDDTTAPPVHTLRMVHIGVADADRAMRFFGTLLGWEAERVPFNDGIRHYVTNTERVLPVLVGEPGYPEVRLGFAVDDPADTARRIVEHGGEVTATDPDGRWLEATDPAGTPLVLWRPGEPHPHAPPWAPATGELDYLQVDVPDADAVLPFYAGVVGFSYEEDNPVPDYHHVAGHTQPMAMGIQGSADERRVRLFFGVLDLDAAVDQVRSLGGTAGERYDWGPMDAVPCTDDQGTRFVLAVVHADR